MSINPWRANRELREANERLAQTIADPLLTGIQIGNGTIDVGMKGAGPQLLAGMFLGMLQKYPDAKNYLEVTFGSVNGPILVTAQKPGGKTPHLLRLEAEQQCKDLRTALQEAATIMGHDGDATEWRERWAHLWGETEALRRRKD